MFFFAIFLSGSPLRAQELFLDSRDGTNYEIFNIGEYSWFKQNLKFKTATSWCFENPASEACAHGNYYYPTDLINVCPDGWRVPTWREYKKALKEIQKYYGLADSVRYVESRVPLYKNLKLDGELVVGLTLIGDSTFFDFATTGWIQGDKWQPQSETTTWIIHEISNTPQPHLHIRNNEVVMHSHGHNIIDKPKKLRRFSVRCLSDTK